MANNKKQHFVPKFLLKNFSVHGNKKQIGIYNLVSGKYITAGPLRNEACGDYFYGRDETLETALKSVEDFSAKVIAKIVLTDKHPEEHHTLLWFMIIQQSRTEYSAEEIAEATENLSNHLPKERKFADHLYDSALGLENPVHSSIRGVLSMKPLIEDLAYKLFINRTTCPFILSDNPVVLHNQFLNSRKKYGSNTGWAVKGLTVFLPISPIHCLMFFDKDVYKVGGKSFIPISLTKTNDVHQLNILQYLNANRNLYFNDEIDEPYIKFIEGLARKFRRTKKTNLVVIPENENSSLLHGFDEDIKIELSLSFVRLTAKAKKYNLGRKRIHYRNEEIVKLYKEFSVLVAQGIYAHTEFERFCQDKFVAMTNSTFMETN